MELRLKLRFAFSLLLLTACTITAPAPLPAPPTLAADIDRIAAAPALQGALWGILIEEEDGRVVYSRNADKLLIPASNRKLFASATIATCLGTTTRLATTIHRDGDDLILKGDGDPSLGSWRFGRENDFANVADLLVARGITRVRDVVADVSAFDRTTMPGSWKLGNIGADYAAPVDALAWGENELPGDRAMPDAALGTAGALRDALVSRGIEVSNTRVQTTPHAWSAPIATLESPFLFHLIMPLLKNSHNLYAEMLLKRAGGGTYEAAFAREQTLLQNEAGIAAGTSRFVDGSGLAPDDLVTPRSTVRIVRWMDAPARRGFWWQLLAQPNNEGTLRKRLIPLEHRLRAKTGTINGVNALSGILLMPNGNRRYFAVVLNHHIADGDEAVAAIDAIVARAAE